MVVTIILLPVTIREREYELLGPLKSCFFF